MVHAIDRAKERYGIDLSLSDLRELAKKISDGDAVLRSRARSGEFWIVVHNGVALNAVFNPRAKVIITFQPREGKLRGGKYKYKKSHVTADDRRPRITDRIEYE